MQDLEEKRYWIWLSLIPNLGSKKIQSLLEEYKDPKTIYHLKEKDLYKIKGIGEKSIKHMVNPQIRESVERHIQYMIKNEIDIISIHNSKYPKILKEIYDPPISLYVKGNTNILNQKAIGIVGCREASQYGKSVAKYFSYHLAQEEINVVSGLAKGVDSYAHVGAICIANMAKKCEDCGKTIAVVANGLDIIYPKENEMLQEEILRTGGAIITEYPLGTKPERMNFPARNRIISGISKGILVVEAKEKSGTLITVDFALEQGRDVFVVPGNINSSNSVGTNCLIKQGAKLVTNYREIFKEKPVNHF